MIIDAHQHFWNYDPVKHAWIDNSMAAIRQSYTPTDLKKVYLENGIDGCVAIQADQSLEETDYLLKLASENEFIKGVVGWVDLRAENIETILDSFSDAQKLKGIRHIVQGESDHNFLLRPDFLNGISRLKAHNLVYDILIFPHQLGAAFEFVKKFPKQKFVIDHSAKPYIKDGLYDGWAVLMKEISKCKNVYCKVSGMTTEADFNTWTPQQIQPYMDLVLEAFGSDRIMYGSDWPVCLVASNYSVVKKLTTDFISNLSIDEQDAILGGNAIQFYNLK